MPETTHARRPARLAPHSRSGSWTKWIHTAGSPNPSAYAALTQRDEPISRNSRTEPLGRGGPGALGDVVKRARYPNPNQAAYGACRKTTAHDSCARIRHETTIPDMANTEWNELLVERRVAPEPLSESEFKAWMHGRAVFISSTMDEEMLPFRSAARAVIADLGGDAVLWEGITPRDQRAEDAYLEGVDRSSLLLLLVGHRYGVADETGYSATHKEVVRAGERGIPRLLFEAGDIGSTERDGRLNDWLRSLYSEVSTGAAQDEAQLRTMIQSRLRELAASQERTWIKLGRLVFPGQVARTTGRSGSALTVTASVREPALRRELGEIVGAPYRAGDTLTWAASTEPVEVRQVDIRTATASRDDVTITCESHGGRRSVMGTILYGTVSAGGRSYGTADQVKVWVEERVLGRKNTSLPDVVRSFFGGDEPSLPQILEANGASGWLAEGLSRLFIVQGALGKFGGYFDTLEVGPATATGIRISVAHVSGNDDVARITDVIPLA